MFHLEFEREKSISIILQRQGVQAFKRAFKYYTPFLAWQTLLLASPEGCIQEFINCKNNQAIC
ncbi:MAG: hypothetical protein B7X06_04300 [Verrucomicrobia bacterium 21-51-4]|nr:MAG: hypothetical protein B7X06_04300 [Verrucomicrobia bacterium 21-51-4]